ncbi:unnamed protein product, partial [Ectocarpus sp. 12 AP-2014]
DREHIIFAGFKRTLAHCSFFLPSGRKLNGVIASFGFGAHTAGNRIPIQAVAVERSQTRYRQFWTALTFKQHAHTTKSFLHAQGRTAVVFPHTYPTLHPPGRVRKYICIFRGTLL